MRWAHKIAAAVPRLFLHPRWGPLMLLVTAAIASLLLFAQAAHRNHLWLAYACTKTPSEVRFSADPVIFLPLRSYVQSHAAHEWYAYQPNRGQLEAVTAWRLFWAMQTAYVFAFLVSLWLLAQWVRPRKALAGPARMSLLVGYVCLFVFLDLLSHWGVTGSDGYDASWVAVKGWPLPIVSGSWAFLRLTRWNLGAVTVDAVLLGLFMFAVAHLMSRFPALRAGARRD